ncbi:hypothetical protein [Kribbella catacumbae]|uniref:hypothetical protein n=1 Tax=Kribbella catacumbae TaxID=460086 RepID=UPI0003767C91|nr:hypothetical protein [Kribbella catacumbae]
MTLWRPIAVAGLLMLPFGCAGDTAGDNQGTIVPPDPTSTATQPEPIEPTEPPVEPTEPETTQPTQKKPSIEIVSAPIGGNAAPTEEGYQCAEVNWLGRTPIPDGTTIKIGSPKLVPEGVFTFDQTGCGDKSPRCTAEIVWRSSGFNPCYVGVKQVTEGDPVELRIPAFAECATEADCQKSLEGENPGSQITFTPAPGSPGG